MECISDWHQSPAPRSSRETAVFSDLFATVAVPKAEELVAFAHHHDDKTAAEAFFLEGMKQAMRCLAEQAHPSFPVTIYYAFRQSEADSEEGTASTLVAKLGSKAETARELAYRLYALCERKKRAAEALAYNGLVQRWPEIVRLAREGALPRSEQAALFGEEV